MNTTGFIESAGNYLVSTGNILFYKSNLFDEYQMICEFAGNYFFYRLMNTI